MSKNLTAIYPQLLSCVRERDNERLALLVRKYYGGAKGLAPQVSVFSLAENAGIKIIRKTMPELGCVLAKDSRGAFEVFIFLQPSIGENSIEANFLVGHLLGHFFLHLMPRIADATLTSQGYRELVSPLKRYNDVIGGSAATGIATEELEADRFAAALILPQSMLRRAAERISDSERLAEFFGVSGDLLVRRSKDFEPAPSPVVKVEKTSGLDRIRALARRIDKSVE